MFLLVLIRKPPSKHWIPYRSGKKKIPKSWDSWNHQTWNNNETKRRKRINFKLLILFCWIYISLYYKFWKVSLRARDLALIMYEQEGASCRFAVTWFQRTAYRISMSWTLGGGRRKMEAKFTNFSSGEYN